MDYPDNDEFLYKRRAEPREAFVATLRQQLNHSTKRQGVWATSGQRIVRYIAPLMILLTALLVASPEARALVGNLLGFTALNFGDVQLNVTDHDLTQTGNNRQPLPESALSLVSIEEAQDVIPFALPSWMPDGFALAQTAQVVRYSADEITILIRLSNTQTSEEILLAILSHVQTQIVVGSGHSGRKIIINGSDGVLYRGSWVDGHYEPSSELHISWTQDGLTYILSSTALEEAKLIRLAEGIR